MILTEIEILQSNNFICQNVSVRQSNAGRCMHAYINRWIKFQKFLDVVLILLLKKTDASS